MNVLDYIASETERQSGTVREGLGMLAAHRYLMTSFVDMGYPIAEGTILHMHRLIKGDDFGGGRYRTTPVYFRDGGHAANAQNIPRLMSLLFEAIRSNELDESRAINSGVSVVIDVPAILTKEFLDIHPFSDGNGRVASLLWNYLRGSLSDPEPMPYFYGENHG